MTVRRVFEVTCDSYGRHAPPKVVRLPELKLGDLLDALTDQGWHVTTRPPHRGPVFLCPECRPKPEDKG